MSYDFLKPCAMKIKRAQLDVRLVDLHKSQIPISMGGYTMKMKNSQPDVKRLAPQKSSFTC